MWENRDELAAMATSPARLSKMLDAELATLATAGDGGAFALLYDRHERRVYGFCLRMLGTEDEAADATQETFMRLLRRLPAMRDRELNFPAYALGAARNACYDMIAARRRVEPVAELLEPPGSELADLALDPERAALLGAAREEVRAANAALPPRQREVLALREVEQLSYEQIGELVGLNGNAVAQLISRARIKLRERIRGGALESIAVASAECARALPLLARAQDAQGNAAEERDWLRAHLDACERCRLSRAAMQEAGVSYRALGPIVPLAWLRHTTIARAADLVGADWSHLADADASAGSGARSSTAPDRGLRVVRTVTGASGGARASLPAMPKAALAGVANALGAGRLRWLLAVVPLCLLLLVLIVGSIAPDPHVALRPASTLASTATARHARATARARKRRTAHRALAHASVTTTSPPMPAPATTRREGVASSRVPTKATHPSRRRVKAHKRPAPHASLPVTAPVPVSTPAPLPPPVTTPTATTPPPSPPSAGTTPTGTETSTGGRETPPPPEKPGPTPGGPGPRGPLG
jgi:RNA polymerase sigma-70 factor (ECF subfamily)